MSFDNKNSQFVDSRAGCVEILVMFMYQFLLYLVVCVYVFIMRFKFSRKFDASLMFP